MKEIRIVITGPECTGKSTLSQRLAEYYEAVFIPEYARTYIEDLGRNYTYHDVVHIAEKQLLQMKENYPGKAVVFFDTWLIITKIWFKIVYSRYPDWIDRELEKGYVDLWLICDTDIPWFADGVRENGGEMREKLLEMYIEEIKRIKGNYHLIKGTGDQRFLNALKVIRRTFIELSS